MSATDPPNRNPPTGSEPVSAVRVTEEEGLRAWVAQLDRKLGTRSYAGAAAVILSLAAAIVAIVLAIDARDNSAAEGDLARVEERVAEISDSAEAAEAASGDIDELESRISGLEGKIDGLSAGSADVEQRIKVIEDDIEDLRGQISDLEPGGGAPSAPAGGPGDSADDGGDDDGGSGGTSPGGD
jgi:TolA-binding protein